MSTETPNSRHCVCGLPTDKFGVHREPCLDHQTSTDLDRERLVERCARAAYEGDAASRAGRVTWEQLGEFQDVIRYWARAVLAEQDRAQAVHDRQQAVLEHNVRVLLAEWDGTRDERLEGVPVTVIAMIETVRDSLPEAAPPGADAPTGKRLMCPYCRAGQIWATDDGTVCTDADAGGAPGCGATWDEIGRVRQLPTRPGVEPR